MDTGTVWAIFFILLLIGFICRIVLIKVGIEKSGNTRFDWLIFSSPPILLILLWNDNTIQTHTKIFNSCLGVVSIVTSYWLYVLKKRARI